MGDAAVGRELVGRELDHRSAARHDGAVLGRGPIDEGHAEGHARVAVAGEGGGEVDLRGGDVAVEIVVAGGEAVLVTVLDGVDAGGRERDAAAGGIALGPGAEPEVDRRDSAASCSVMTTFAKTPIW